MKEGAEITALVQKIVFCGRNGPYAVTLWDPDERNRHVVTFSLSEGIWQEASYPLPGEYVLLSELRKMRQGWRAMRARRPSIMEGER